MTQLNAMFLITLLAPLLAIAPLPAASSPFKVAQVDLRTSPHPAGEMRNVFSVPEKC